MQVSPSVRAVQVPETNPMHPQFTTIYLVGRGQVLTIDSGADEDRYRWMLRGYLAATEKAEIGQATLSHFHFDHSSNIRWLCDEFGAQAYVSPDTASSNDAWAISAVPSSKAVRCAWDDGVRCISTAMPSPSKNPCVWPARSGMFASPAKTLTRI